MAPQDAQPAKQVPVSTTPKLPPLTKGTRIQKRPLPRRQQPASGNSHIIYVSSSTPFMSIVKRVRKRLDKSLRVRGPATRSLSLYSRIEALKRQPPTNGGSGGEGAEILILGTGKAIEKTMSVAAWFEDQGDCEVDIRTRSVGAVDDVVEKDGSFAEEGRLRKLSCLEVAVRFK